MVLLFLLFVFVGFSLFCILYTLLGVWEELITLCGFNFRHCNILSLITHPTTEEVATTL